MTLREILDACEGRWYGDPGLLDRAPADIVTDSRKAGPGSLFIALRGERTDGHRYIPDVLERGVLAVLCEEEGPAGEPRLVVPSVMKALRHAARWNRNRFSIPFVGITGSVGKTTAKEMTAAVLAAHGPTFKTPGSMNGQLGIPVALMGLEPGYEAAVMEMGISLPGEMRRLSSVVRPDMAVFMNIGDSHLEALGDRQGILREKAEMLAYSAPDAPLICNGDDPLLNGWDFGRPVIRFGLGSHCQVRGTDLMTVDGGEAQRCTVCHDGGQFSVYIPAYGVYMIYAVLAAAAVGLTLGLTEEEIIRGVAADKTVGHRSRIVHTGYCTLIDDCYNANPTSNRAAIDSMAGLPGRKVCILGDMREMGPQSRRLHEEIGRYAAEHGVQALYTQGEDAAYMAQAAGDIARHFPDKAALIAALPELIRPGDLVLVKASHGPAFDEVAAAVEALRG